ncbi:MAG: hypothetical protein ACO280_04000 [Pseudohongiellaceae bacterium]
MTGAVAEAGRRLQGYLLGPRVQLASGGEAGGVVGSAEPGGAPDYVYGEITGYFLHWIASATADVEQRRHATQAAADWLQHYLAEQPWPATRRYLGPAPADWRNQALFAFDLAMVAGGVARTATAGLLAPTQALVARLGQLLCQFATGPALATVIAAPAASLPRRWSTEGGPFSAKTASRVLLLHAHCPLDANLVGSCRALLSRYAVAAADFPPEMLHPTLYALEGVLLAEGVDYERVARGLERLLQWQAPDGSLPESLATPEVRRNDVAAQALRLAILLEQRLGDRGRFAAPIARLGDWLIPQVAADGSLAFAAGRPHSANTWCALFAEQALRLLLARERGEPLPLAEADLV